MFEHTFKNIDDILHKDAGCGSELDYVEQTSWVLFLKYLDDLERDKGTAAELSGKTYTTIIAPEYQWRVWATAKLSALRQPQVILAVMAALDKESAEILATINALL